MRSLRSYLLIGLTLSLTIALFSCSKSKDNPGPGPGQPGNKTMKFTLTTTGLQAADDFSLTVTGSDIQATATTLFKVNGILQNNQKVITISKAQLMAGQVVIETLPLYTVSISAGGFSGTAGHSFTFKLEPVINGAAQTVVNKTITTTAYADTFTFN
ncbi:hypothetical protein SAMN04488055_5041 [Chitinophaga niabensis]|uniref:Calx-beta domain-containing protein n=2 Tax=Chitinophaga niabensis TaxID=536979 RepID=A0A1N6K467_9BACT|nr:hypothetical protein SAMN04488055_5041 [Chitinophaga niabensis]